MVSGDKVLADAFLKLSSISINGSTMTDDCLKRRSSCVVTLLYKKLCDAEIDALGNLFDEISGTNRA